MARKKRKKRAPEKEPLLVNEVKDDAGATQKDEPPLDHDDLTIFSPPDSLNPNSEGSEQKEEIDTTFSGIFFYILVTTLLTAFTFDFSLGLFVLGAFMAHSNLAIVAPVVTAILNISGFFEFSLEFAASPALAEAFEELNSLEKLKKIDEIAALKKRIGRIPRNASIVGCIGALAAFPMLFANGFLSFLGQNEIVSSTAQRFFRPYIPFFLLAILRLPFEFILLTTKKMQQKIIMAVMASGVLLCTSALQYALAFKTSLGIVGLSIGAGISPILTLFLFTIYIARYYQNFGFFKSYISWEPGDYQQIISFLKNAGPMVLASVGDVSIPFILALIAGRLPGDALHLQNVASQIINFNTVIIAAGSQTTAIMIAGLKKKSWYDTIKLAAKTGVLVNFLLQLLVVGTIWIFPTPFINLIGANVDATEIFNLLLLTGVYTLIDGARYNMLQTTRSLGENVVPSAISTTLLLASAGTAYPLSQYTKLGLLALPTAMCVGASTSAAILAYRLPGVINAPRERDNTPTESKASGSVAQVAVVIRESTIQQTESESSLSIWCCFFRKKPRHAGYEHIPEIRAEVANNPPPVRSSKCPVSCVIM